jgi:membrane associated rhomboid family serine protease
MDQRNRRRYPDRSIVLAAVVTTVAVFGLWVLKFLEWGLDLELHRFGVYPRTTSGLIGIVLAPLIHGSFQHLVSNTLPLLLLGTMLFYGYPRSRLPALLLIWIGSGIGVWLSARASYHFGASGVTHGLMFFLLVSGFLRRDRLSVVLAMLAFFLYGGMVWTIFPTEPGISFESHFWGAAMGLLAAGLFRNRDRPLPERTYSWERDGDRDDPVIGELWRGDHREESVEPGADTEDAREEPPEGR